MKDETLKTGLTDQELRIKAAEIAWGKRRDCAGPLVTIKEVEEIYNFIKTPPPAR